MINWVTMAQTKHCILQSCSWEQANKSWLENIDKKLSEFSDLSPQYYFTKWHNFNKLLVWSSSKSYYFFPIWKPGLWDAEHCRDAWKPCRCCLIWMLLRDAIAAHACQESILFQKHQCSIFQKTIRAWFKPIILLSFGGALLGLLSTESSLKIIFGKWSNSCRSKGVLRVQLHGKCSSSNQYIIPKQNMDDWDSI